jgi:RNA polymerase sigma-70 factor, ECF subfamily
VTDPQAWLVLQAQSGDRVALEALLETVQGPLYRYVLGLTGDRSVADDVLQDTLVRIYRKLRWLDDPTLFRPWAYRIASREAFRSMGRRRQVQEREVDDSALDALRDVEVAVPDPGDLDRLVSQASPASRTVLLLHYQNDLTIEEVAGVLGISAGTVKSRLAYGLRRLRQTIKRTAP